MTKRVVQFIATLLILVLHIGGVLNLYASTAAPTKQFSQREHATKGTGCQLSKCMHSHHHIDEGAYEKVEESDSNCGIASNFFFPQFTYLLQRSITFSLFPILCNKQQLNECTEQLSTCFDGEKFIFYQDFRI